MILTVEQARPLIPGAPSSDAALQVLLDAAEAAIMEALAPDEVTETFRPRGPLIVLSREADDVTVTECGTETDEDAWSLSGDALRRVTGTWRWPVSVTYTPRLPDPSALASAQLALVKLEVNARPGVTSEQIGPWTEAYAANSVWNPHIERAAILDGLRGGFEGIR